MECILNDSLIQAGKDAVLGNTETAYIRITATSVVCTRGVCNYDYKVSLMETVLHKFKHVSAEQQINFLE